jgi:GR25 family glycosyltransferase involved in LPS biosynthesis
MITKYNIISIGDPRREKYRRRIRAEINLDEVHVPAINGSKVDIDEELERRGLKINQPAKFTKGEMGIWLSVFDCWAYARDNNIHLVVFEDDAIITGEFNNMFHNWAITVPEDYDFLSLWVPDNQRQDYYYNVQYDEHGVPQTMGPNLREEKSLYNYGNPQLAKVYQGYGTVATLYSPHGAAKLIHSAQNIGIYSPIDCYICQEAHVGRANGYAPKPMFATAVSYDWKAETTVHKTEIYTDMRTK